MRLLLIDSNHLAARCRFSQVNHLATSDGRNTGVLYGVLRGVAWAKQLFHLQSLQVAMFWDGGRAARRMEIYPDYKAHRTVEDPTEEEKQDKAAYFAQIDLAQDALRAAGIRQVRVWGVEADDLISIYASYFASHGHHVTIYSGDHDMHQLVNDRIDILDREDRPLDPAKIREKWSLSPGLIPLAKAMSGDDSDNITGIPDIGPKRAAAIADQPHLLFSRCFQPPEIDDKLWQYFEKARCHMDIIVRNLRLITLPRNWDQSYYGIEEATQANQQLFYDDVTRDIDRFVEFCHDWELESVLENLHQW